MIRKTVKAEDYFEIASQNEYYIWHFIQKNQSKNSLTLYSFFDKKIDPPDDIHELKYIMDKVEIPYFESYTEDSIDFLMGFGFSGNQLYVPSRNEQFYTDREFFFKPIIFGFNRFKVIKSTKEICYCSEGLIDIIYNLDSKFITTADFD